MAEISFGLVNRGGLSEDEIRTRVYEAARLVNLDLDRLDDRSPFTLSGGEQRKVAIASIISMDPDILIFDEPTQGLDSRSRTETLRHIKELNTRGKTVIVISHDMEEIIRVADRIIILERGKIVLDRTPEALFRRPEGPGEGAAVLARCHPVINRFEGEGMGYQDKYLSFRPGAERDTVRPRPRSLPEGRGGIDA